MRTCLTNEQKLKVREFWAKHPDLAQFEVADWVKEQFNVTIGRATLYRIYHAPQDAFTGGLNKKKNRRVKYPEFEQDVLAFLETCRREQTELTDEQLLLKAAELRALRGIGEENLRLSNGWLYKFKERHNLKGIPRPGEPSDQQSLGADGEEQQVGTTDGMTAATNSTSPSARASTITPVYPVVLPKRGRGRPRGRASASNGRLTIGVATGVTGTEASADTTTTDPASISNIVTGRDVQVIGTVATTTSSTINNHPAIYPLTYLSAKSLSTVESPGTCNWERTSGQRDEQYFAIVNDGICILRDGKYQINVDLQHSLPLGRFDCVFKVYEDSNTISECTSFLRCDKEVALSVLQLTQKLSANAIVRVEFLAPGYAFHTSRLVLRLVQ